MGAKPGAMRPVSRRVAPSAMKEGALAESKKQIDQLIYKMVVKHDRGGNARSNPMASELPDLSALAPKAVTPAQKDTLAKVTKMLKDQGLI
jgi:hypothetical protein